MQVITGMNLFRNIKCNYNWLKSMLWDDDFSVSLLFVNEATWVLNVPRFLRFISHLDSNKTTASI